MPARIEYHKGDKLGPYNIKFIEEVESYIRPNGKKDRKGKFICPHCQKEFIAKFYDITKNSGRKGCPDCVKRMRQEKQTKHRIGQTYGPYNTILLKKIKKIETGHTFLGEYQCGSCGKIFEARHNNLMRHLAVCSDCGRRGARVGDLVGPKKNFLVTKIFQEKDQNGHYLYEFKCPACGKLFKTYISNINNGSRTSCGCLNPNFSEDLTGKIFGKLTVLSETNERDSHGEKLWKCKCSCGTIKLIRGSCLKRGRTKSCGCRKESYGEEEVRIFLQSLNINFETQKIFKNCINPKTKHVLYFDFYLPDYNCCIEYDGDLHFKESSLCRDTLKERQYRDNIKNQYCEDNNIKLIRIPYTEFDNVEEILTKELSL